MIIFSGHSFFTSKISLVENQFSRKNFKRKNFRPWEFLAKKNRCIFQLLPEVKFGILVILDRIGDAPWHLESGQTRQKWRWRCPPVANRKRGSTQMRSSSEVASGRSWHLAPPARATRSSSTGGDGKDERRTERSTRPTRTADRD